MPKPDFCGYCVRMRLKEHGRFDGFKDLNPAVCTIRGTRVCGAHTALALAEWSVEVEAERAVHVPEWAKNVAKGYEVDLQVALEENRQLRAIIDESVSHG